MSVIDRLLHVLANAFMDNPPTGFIPGEVDPLEAQRDLVFGAPDPTFFAKEIDWTGELQLLRQYGFPFCVSFAVAHIQTRNQQREGVRMQSGAPMVCNPEWLAVESGTSWRGNNITTVLDVARKKGIPSVEQVPLRADRLSTSQWSEMFRMPATNPTLNAVNKIGGYARIGERDTLQIKAALQSGPILCGFGIGGGYSAGGVVGNPASIGNYHVVTLAGYDQCGNWKIGDSLVPQEKVLSGAYRIPWIYSIEDLPTDWKEQQQNALERAYPNALKNRFGLPRDYPNEVAEANLFAINIKPAVKKDPRLGGIFGKLWTVMVAGLVYGGYTQPDMIRWAQFYAETGRELFDLNEPKN